LFNYLFHLKTIFKHSHEKQVSNIYIINRFEGHFVFGFSIVLCMTQEGACTTRPKAVTKDCLCSVFGTLTASSSWNHPSEDNKQMWSTLLLLIVWRLAKYKNNSSITFENKIIMRVNSYNDQLFAMNWMKLIPLENKFECQM